MCLIRTRRCSSTESTISSHPTLSFIASNGVCGDSPVDLSIRHPRSTGGVPPHPGLSTAMSLTPYLRARGSNGQIHQYPAICKGVEELTQLNADPSRAARRQHEQQWDAVRIPCIHVCYRQPRPGTRWQTLMEVDAREVFHRVV
jgi:hypothetical protein